MLTGKIAIVTGGASGIGRAVVKKLVTDGARVIVADLDIDRATALATEIGKESARAYQVDVANPASVEAMVGFAMTEFGRLDLAVNNAGVGVQTKSIADVSVEEWQRVIDIDLSSVFYSLKFEVPAMLAGGGGAIVNMSSILGLAAVAGSASYTAAKHGVVGLTKAAALEYGAQGIRVNAIGPGFIDTPLLAKEMTKEERATLADLHALKRIGQPDEIAGLTSFLLSDQASFLTGGFHAADGGYLAQ